MEPGEREVPVRASPRHHLAIGAVRARRCRGLSFYQPTDDGWRRGDRDIVCYATREDGAAMTRSVKAGTP